MPELSVPDSAKGLRLDRFLARPELGLGLSRSQIQKLIGASKILLNGQPAASKTPLAPGQSISVEIPKALPSRLLAEEMPLDILYEDADLLIINKPAGLVVHPGAGHASGTLANALVHHIGRKAPGEGRAGIVHRLDKDTTGCLAAAKTGRAFKSLSAQIASHEAGRTYLALAWGRFDEEQGSIDAPLGRSRTDRRKFAVRVEKGRQALTHFKVKERFTHATLLELKLATGRTHQIRAHLLSIGRPVIGDQDYGAAPQSAPAALRAALLKAVPRQALHAWRLDLKQPSSGKAIRAEAPVPADFQAALKVLRKPPK